MKVQLVVVRGKPEGKVIPLIGPKFKIGRGETCHLRPISEQISREHAEFTLEANAVLVRDLGSRNGTLVNGKALTEPYILKDRDLVQVGPLTFAVSITETAAAAPAARPMAAASPAAKSASPDDISTDDIDSWLIGPNAAASAEQPTAVYGGDTITIAAFKDASASPKPTSPPPSASDDEYERQPEDDDAEERAVIEDETEDESQEEEDEDQDDEQDEPAQEEFMDESNPFYAAKKALKEQSKAGPTKPAFKDTSDAAGDILRRLMERKRADRNS